MNYSMSEQTQPLMRKISLENTNAAGKQTIKTICTRIRVTSTTLTTTRSAWITKSPTAIPCLLVLP